MKSTIGHIILNVKHFGKSETFYDKLMTELGFKIVFKINENEYALVSYNQGEHTLWIRCDKKAEHNEFVRDVGLDHLAFLVNSQNDVDCLFEIVRNLDVKITRQPKNYPEYTDTYYAFYFRDPDGVPLEIYTT